MNPKSALTKEEIDRRQRAAIANHIPGITHALSDGSRYLVDITGAWKRQTKRRHEGRTGLTKSAQRRRKRGA